jgi:hypothetical protein
MKTIIILLTLILSLPLNGQVIDVNNFDEKLFEKVLFEKMITYRKSIGSDSIVWSEVLYSNIAKPNTIKMVNDNKLYHPDEGDIWKNPNMRVELGNELSKKQNFDILQSLSGPMFMSFEIAARISSHLVTTYQELADRAINGWSKSPGHKDIQSMDMSKDGAFGMAGCSVKLSDDKLNYFIEFDFSIPYCIYKKRD